MNYKVLINLICIFSFCDLCLCENENREDNGESVEQYSLAVPEHEMKEDKNQVPCTRRMNSMVHEVKYATEGQFPYMAAVMSYQNEYLCAGTVVSNGMILTSARCVGLPVDHVLLNTLNDKNENAIKLKVLSIEKFPTYSVASSGVKDVGLIYTVKHNNTVATKIKFSEVHSAEKIKEMEILGYGLNTETGQTKELQFVGVANVPGDIELNMKGIIECIDTKVPTCFKDFGGPAVWKDELIGIVYKGNEQCIDTLNSAYTSNILLAEITPIYYFKGWLVEQIDKSEKAQLTVLRTHSKPIFKDQGGKTGKTGTGKETRRQNTAEAVEMAKKALGQNANHNVGFFAFVVTCFLILQVFNM